ncbi:MAG: glycosyltransferase family 4 protein [Parvibaculum sp.]
MIQSGRKKIAFVISASSALRAFMLHHVIALSERYDITIFSNYSTDSFEDVIPENIRLIHIPFERPIAPVADLKCAFLLYRYFQRENFDVVHSLLPKAGLLGMVTSFLACVPHRIHVFTGQVWVTKTGLARFVLKNVDRLIGKCASTVFSDSQSQSDFLAKEGVVHLPRVLGSGSVSGVDLKKFYPCQADGHALRQKLAFPANAVVFGFLGRLTDDKGILDLADAFANAALPSHSVLFIVGPDEDGVVQRIREKHGDLNGRLFVLGFTRAPEQVLNAFDVYCLPSYREGFGTSVIEAAACGVPTLASRIYGLTDAVEEGVTGLMHVPQDIFDIQSKLELLANDEPLRQQLGEAALQRVRDKFSVEVMVAEMKRFYAETVG